MNSIAHLEYPLVCVKVSFYRSNFTMLFCHLLLDVARCKIFSLLSRQAVLPVLLTDHVKTTCLKMAGHVQVGVEHVDS
jgi:hypothetical protein